MILSRRLFILLSLLLATFLRFWKLDTLPPGLYHDEAYNGLDALSLLRGKTFPQFYEGWELYSLDAHAERPPENTRFPIFFEGNYGREPLHIYLMALSVEWFGATPFAVRAVPAAAGVLAVMTTFLAATALDFTRRPRKSGVQQESSKLDIRFASNSPVYAAFLMAILYPAVHFSRFGIRAMLFVPVETMAVYCFWRGLVRENDLPPKNSNALWFVASGLFLGLGLYTYAASRLLPLVFVGFVLVWAWSDPPGFWRMASRIALMAVVSLAVAMPLLIYFARYPYYLVFRIAYVANKGKGTVEGNAWLTWFNNIGRVVRGLFWTGETHLRHNLPGRPYLDLVQAALFLTGAAQSLRQWRQLRHIFLLLWLLVMLLPTVLSGDAPHFGRMVGAAPVVAILAGQGADRVWQALRYRFSWLVDRLTPGNGARTAIFAYGSLIVLFTISTWLTFRDYFITYARLPDLAVDFYQADWQLGQYAAARSPESDLYLTPTQAEMATIYFALADPTRLRSYSGAGGLVPAGRPGRPHVYLIRPEDRASLANLMGFFPQGEVKVTRPTFISFHVAGDAPSSQAAVTTDYSWQGLIKLVGWTQQVRDEQLQVTLFWQAESKMDRDYTAYVHIAGAEDGIVSQLDRPPLGYPTSDWEAGEVVVDQYLLPLPAKPFAVEYQLRTGWYHLPTMQALGNPYLMGEWEPYR